MKIANAPCSWGVLEFELQGKSPDYTQVLDEMHAIGYGGTELGDWGFMPTDPVQLRDELAARELTLLGAFVPVALAKGEAHAAGEASALQHARLLAEVAGRYRSLYFRMIMAQWNTAHTMPGVSALSTA